MIYAYDELQKLNEGESLSNPQDFLIPKTKPFDDRILKVCYRNSRPVLVTAHALGFGIYRKKSSEYSNLVQFFDQPQLWKDVGYLVKEGEFKPKKNIVLKRNKESSPDYLEKNIELDDLIIFKTFENKDEQAKWVADEIEKDIKQNELHFTDIIVINPIARTTKDEVANIRLILSTKNIGSHIAGAINANNFFEANSITFTGINRAKGNEVPMVYIINAQDCYAGRGINKNRNLIKNRNILFTAITRSKAWVRVIGIGDEMNLLTEEYNQIKSNNFELNFTYPSKSDIEHMNIIHRDISKSEENDIQNDVESMKNFNEIIDKINRRETFLEDYPAEFQKLLKRLTNV